MSMITDAELLELEILLIDKYNSQKFGEIYHNEITNEIIALKKDLEQLLLIFYPDRYRIFQSRVIISTCLFKLVQMRYFSTNATVTVKKLKSPFTKQK